MCPSPPDAPVPNEHIFSRQVARILRPEVRVVFAQCEHSSVPLTPRSQGFFLILSCNHDMEELRALLEPAGLRLHRDLSAQVAGVDPDLTLACFKKPATP